jgi:hypothetical protein
MPKTVRVGPGLVVTLVAFLGLTHSARAEPPRLSPSAMHSVIAQSLERSLPNWAVSDVAAIALRTRLRRARILAVIGSGFLVGGIVHAATFGRRHVCSEPEKRMIGPPITGGLMAGLGFGLTLGGGIMMAHVPGDFRDKARLTPGAKAGMAFAALGVAVISAATLFAVSASEWIDCFSS